MQSEGLKENEEGITFLLDSVSLSPVLGPHKIISNLVGGQNLGDTILYRAWTFLRILSVTELENKASTVN